MAGGIETGLCPAARIVAPQARAPVPHMRSTWTRLLLLFAVVAVFIAVLPAAAQTPASGTPASGTPASGTPASGTPASGTPASGTSASGTSSGVPLPPSSLQLPKITFVEGTDKPEDVTLGLKFLLLLSFFSVAPSFIMMATSFTRVVIVLTFVKRAIGTQDLPPNQVTATLALFLTFFIMAPTIKEIKEVAWEPYEAKEITTIQAYERAVDPIRNFMLKQTRQKDLALFVRLSGLPRPRNAADVPTWIIIPSFMISELTTAFLMGVYIFLPFIVIDMVVASTLMSMGMIMLPPVLISLPFKILLFILVDGWNLVALSIVESFTR